MSNNDISRKLNALKSIARFGKHQFMNLGPGAMIRMFGSGRNLVSFIAVKSLNEFDSITTELYKTNSKVPENYTLNTFQSEVAGLLRKLHKENRDATKKDWDSFSQHLINKPNITVHILAPIYGVKMDSTTVKLGDFIIYNPLDIKQVLRTEFPTIYKRRNTKALSNNEYKIGITVTAKDVDKCYELADNYFSSFENTANFITANFHKTNRIGIFNYTSSKSIDTFILAPAKVYKTTKSMEHFATVQIDNPYYQDEETGNKTLWKWITKKESKLQHKIIDAVEWCGRASVESDDSKAVLQYIISIEALLHTEESSPIKPSIISLMSDMVAFLLGDTYEQRISYKTYVRELYNIRSAISHGGSKLNVSTINLHTALVLCHKIIRKIITAEPYKSCLTKKELCLCLENLKYGKPQKK